MPPTARNVTRWPRSEPSDPRRKWWSAGSNRARIDSVGMNKNASEPQNTKQAYFTTPRGLRRAWGMGLETIYAHLRAGNIRSMRVGKRFLVPVSEIEDFPARVARGEVE